MKTLMKIVGNTIVVSMDGKLDFETHIPLRENLNRLIRQVKSDSTPNKIIFNLENLEFVGSSGISSFVQALKDFSANVPIRPQYCNVRSEFKRVMKAFDEDALFDFFDDSDSPSRKTGLDQ